MILYPKYYCKNITELSLETKLESFIDILNQGGNNE